MSVLIPAGLLSLVARAGIAACKSTCVGLILLSTMLFGSWCYGLIGFMGDGIAKMIPGLVIMALALAVYLAVLYGTLLVTGRWIDGLDSWHQRQMQQRFKIGS